MRVRAILTSHPIAVRSWALFSALLISTRRAHRACSAGTGPKRNIPRVPTAEQAQRITASTLGRHKKTVVEVLPRSRVV
jgi:hypothetical protein